DAARKGIPFDVLGADFGHHGEDCTFETLVKRFALKDRRVKVISEMVHEADLHDGKFTRNESIGLDLAVKGLAESTQDDHELLERGMAILHGPYTVLKRKAEHLDHDRNSGEEASAGTPRGPTRPPPREGAER